jgi:hypothetical protein
VKKDKPAKTKYKDKMRGFFAALRMTARTYNCKDNNNGNGKDNSNGRDKGVLAGWGFTSHPSQVRDGWGTRSFVAGEGGQAHARAAAGPWTGSFAKKRERLHPGCVEWVVFF